MLENKIGFMASLGFSGMPAEQVVGHLKELGYNAVEWTLAHFNPRAKSPAELRQVVEATPRSWSRTLRRYSAQRGPSSLKRRLCRRQVDTWLNSR